ncbi:DUF4105 domain-containing protein [Arenimonas composti]|uniref:Uncharacterized protein n=1 Tax=Arenimonas composti TR7-09 = DSM 18010 TaxID=1121013 RepID=A0A091BK25_9GAMM|nr:DUF4105 domain-containing protein [Arenimonas composti]KFN51154.1 hypothetical protein P873_04450 [Arenimonas composti TR7-09 = DSM 18010]
MSPPRAAAVAAWLLAAWLLLGTAVARAAGAPVQDAPVPAATGQDDGTQAAPPQARGLRIGILTMEPGEIFFERFGHNAIVVDDPAAAGPVSYNYGYFDLDEEGFVWNFARGRMVYRLVALPLERDLRYYAEVGRGATMQWLDLPPERAAALAARLHDQATGPESRYRYEYFTSNCSTKVRDGIDFALEGALHRQLVPRSQGDTWRSEAVRLAAPAPWMALGFHLGLAGWADQPLSRWDEAFVPMRLRDDLRRITLADGRPLVASEEVLLPHRLGQPPDAAPRWRLPALLLGIAIAAVVFWSARRAPRLLGLGAGLFWLFAGLCGVLMGFLWFGSDHVAGHANQNLLLLSPLALGLLPAAWAKLRGRTPGAWFRPLLWTVAGMAALAGFLKFLPFLDQQNTDWVLLLLPVHWALLKTFDPKRETSGE